jgi:MoaA/NifB/PqqE/SkfB family radical SAM enzyme
VGIAELALGDVAAGIPNASEADVWRRMVALCRDYGIPYDEACRTVRRVYPWRERVQIALDEPPTLVWTDRAMARELGVEGGALWAGDDDADLTATLVAPTEVHVMTTNRCPAGCPGCYTSAVPESDDLVTSSWTRALDRLAEMGVFHVALGGGESLLREDLFALAEHARRRGLVPNLTTSGLGLTEEKAAACRVFGQVNVSLDGVGEVYRASRGYDGARVALRAMERLIAAGVPTGINFVVSRVTWDAMASTVAAVAEMGGNEVEFLRFKPAGRGADVYDDYALSEAQARSVLPKLLRLQAQYPTVHMKIDCSFVPFVCAANPDLGVLEQFGIYGCEAGHALSAIDANGIARPCSFVDDPNGDVEAVMSIFVQLRAGPF